MPRPPFDLLRGCFHLLAVILIIEVLASIMGGVLCWVTNIRSATPTVGACSEAAQQIRETWSEILAAILALLLAARPPGPPPP